MLLIIPPRLHMPLWLELRRLPLYDTFLVFFDWDFNRFFVFSIGSLTSLYRANASTT